MRPAPDTRSRCKCLQASTAAFQAQGPCSLACSRTAPVEDVAATSRVLAGYCCSSHAVVRPDVTSIDWHAGRQSEPRLLPCGAAAAAHLRGTACVVTTLCVQPARCHDNRMCRPIGLVCAHGPTLPHSSSRQRRGSNAWRSPRRHVLPFPCAPLLVVLEGPLWA